MTIYYHSLNKIGEATLREQIERFIKKNEYWNPLADDFWFSKWIDEANEKADGDNLSGDESGKFEVCYEIKGDLTESGNPVHFSFSEKDFDTTEEEEED